MKKTYIIILLAAAFMLTGCDFFRKVAGRPTSEDIEVKRAEIVRVEAQKAREQARQDSIRVAQEQARLAQEQAVKDSLEALTALKEKGCMMYDLTRVKGLLSGELNNRYCVVVGSFKDAANADKFVEKVAKDTLMQPVKLRFRNGMVSVGVCPRNKVAEIAGLIDDVRAKSFCPKDAWILVNEQ
jgi:hypothetical protein